MNRDPIVAPFLFFLFKLYDIIFLAGSYPVFFTIASMFIIIVSIYATERFLLRGASKNKIYFLALLISMGIIFISSLKACEILGISALTGRWS
jgi:hypothetical protein